MPKRFLNRLQDGIDLAANFKITEAQNGDVVCHEEVGPLAIVDCSIRRIVLTSINFHCQTNHWRIKVHDERSDTVLSAKSDRPMFALTQMTPEHPLLRSHAATQTTAFLRIIQPIEHERHTRAVCRKENSPLSRGSRKSRRSGRGGVKQRAAACGSFPNAGDALALGGVEDGLADAQRERRDF